MNRFLLMFLFMMGLWALKVSAVDACGSKFLHGSKDVRYQRVLANIKPAKILVYWQRDAKTEEDDRYTPDSFKDFEDVGHTVEVAFTSDSFLESAANGGFEILLMRLDAARNLKSEIAEASPNSSVLPTLDFPSRPELNAARKEFGNALKLPDKLANVLKALEKSRKEANKKASQHEMAGLS